MGRVGVVQLAHLPFVRHTVDPDLLVDAWSSDDGAALVLAGRATHEGIRTVATGFGRAASLTPLLDRAAATHPVPARLLISAGAEPAVPAAWRWEPGRPWHWMLTRDVPAEQDGDPRVEELRDPTEVAALLDREAPDSFARPGTPGVEAWLGVRADGVLLAAGAVLRQHDGSGHLRAVTVSADARGRGLGRLLSTALTHRALIGPRVSSLGVYADNGPALRIYAGLGYRTCHTLVGGPLTRRSSTTAVAPSR
ncbi:GNAT family N-acetyltransferase [Nocardioides coralli]|uniref:GNAT family N-acetyltransferase n=1 Tax=Nocardioides coralli TaxID=2872154 RepID=UPI001CA3C770|nr:GNAT family N-acetyltransferase [Nocardioides coralli]QZY28560.1 GNAT family N-acetyltransferase [Nocardioides coralli]